MELCDTANMIDILNQEFIEVQDENIKLKEEIKILKFNVCIAQFMVEFHDRRWGSSFDDDYDEEDYCYNDKTSTLLKEIYDWENHTCDNWYRTANEFPCVSWKVMFPWAYNEDGTLKE
tara:strand:+ start:3939 stop:4292 length:354 start_codon:yes stop_codon:yes gene_type:complete